MKPKTKLQIRIMELSKSLPIVSNIHKEWSNNNHKKYFVRHYKNFVCLECNHTWRNDLPEWTDGIVKNNCPYCKNEIELIKENKPRFERFHIFSIVTTVQEFQVIRYFTTWKMMGKNRLPSYNSIELFQEWDLDFKKKTVIIGLAKTGSYYSDGFKYGSNFDIKNAYGFLGNYRYSMRPDFVYPNIDVLPIFYRNGFENNFYDSPPRIFLQHLLGSSVFETLLKLKNKHLIECYLKQPENIESYWKQILICLKHNFIFEDFSLWHDYIGFLQYFDLDINNPKFICPKDLHKSHAFYMIKKEIKEENLRKIRDEKQKIEDQKRREIEAIALKLKKEHFKDFVIDNGKFKVVVLLKAKDFKKEGKKLNHCVGTSDYINRKDSLILSARIKNQPIETIEISLSKLEILQIRGYDNKPTEYHNEILDLMKSNLPKIGRLIKKHQKEISSKKLA